MPKTKNNNYGNEPQRPISNAQSWYGDVAGKERFIILIIFLSPFLSLYSCNRSKTLLIKNITERYDTLPIRVKINNRLEFNENLIKTKVSLDYYKKNFKINGDSICVNVELPTLGLSEHSCATTEDGNLVIVTINEIFSQAVQDSISKITSANQDNFILKIPKISIAFLKQKLDEVH